MHDLSNAFIAILARNENAFNKSYVPGKGPINLLYALFPDVKYDCVYRNGPIPYQFKMVVTVNNYPFEGTGKQN